jgi:hypothetical protein
MLLGFNLFWAGHFVLIFFFFFFAKLDILFYKSEHGAGTQHDVIVSVILIMIDL